ncbi:MAG TPA: ABC transporter ATP-binding protein [Candidatus Limnocylindrales bacterium]
MDGGYAIETTALAKRFGAVEAVAGIDLRVPIGSVFGFLGPNGAGKTTTIRMLVGLIRPTRGSARVLGSPVTIGGIDLRGVGAVVERPAFYPYLSATSNLRVFAAMQGVAGPEAKRQIAAALDRTGLETAANRKVGGFSTGMRQRLGLALAMLLEPRLVILDEPTNGLDPAGVVEVRATITELARSGATVFLSSHVLTEVEQLCDQVAVLAHGRIVATGAPRDLLAGPGVIRVRFDTPAEAASARAMLIADGVEAMADESGETVESGLLVALPSGEGSRLSRRLAEAGLFPAELTPVRQTLEAAFLELTRDAARDDGDRPDDAERDRAMFDSESGAPGTKGGAR